jgi:ring-1,2-phenylacetyl-CoA epoxidase subunit PaaE
MDTKTAKTMFHALRIAEVRRETRDAVSIRFEVPPALEAVFTFAAGQYVTVRAVIDGAEVRRNYSICAAPLDGELRIAVKALPGGVFSVYANERLRAGDVIEVMPAAGHFTAPFGPDRALRYAAFAAGSGITPILSIIRTVLQVEPRSRFTLVYGNRVSGQILFLDALAALKNRFMARFDVYHFLSAEEEEIALFNGRLDRAKCEQVLEDLIDPATLDLCFICGPEGMMAAAERALWDRGVAPEAVRLERFVAGGTAGPSTASLAAISQAAGRSMGVVLEGRRSTVVFDAALGNILDSVRASGVAAPFACKGGVCATCRAKIVSGRATMGVNYGLTPDEVAQGYILTCQATPVTDDLVITYDT